MERDNLRAWLQKMGIPDEDANKLLEEGVRSLKMLSNLCVEDLVEMGLRKLPARALIKHARKGTEHDEFRAWLQQRNATAEEAERLLGEGISCFELLAGLSVEDLVELGFPAIYAKALINGAKRDGGEESC